MNSDMINLAALGTIAVEDGGNFANEFGSHPQTLCDFCDSKA